MPTAAAGLRLVYIAVDLISAKQLLMRPDSVNLPVVKHQDAVGMLNA